MGTPTILTNQKILLLLLLFTTSIVLCRQNYCLGEIACEENTMRMVIIKKRKKQSRI